jgi:glucose-6-phosphate isomerase
VGATDQHSQIQLYNEGPNDKVVTFIQVQKPDNNTVIPNALPNVDALGYLANQSFHTLLTAEFEATRASLTRNQRPNVTLTLPSITPYSFAQLLLMFEVQTAIAGYLLNIDPFDQPGVELAKQYTYALMGRKGFEHLIAEAKGEAPLAV